MKNPFTAHRSPLTAYRIPLTVLLLFAFCSLTAFAQKTIISGKIEEICFEQVDLQSLYKNDGVSFGKAEINHDGTFKLVANIPQTDLYKLVFNDGQIFMLCLSPNQNIDLTLDCENLPMIKSVKGSPSIAFCKTAAEMYRATIVLKDSMNKALQTDKDIQFYNEFQSQLNPFLDANTRIDAYCMQVAKTTDSLQQFLNSKVIKGKVDSKEIDVFIYTASNFLKTIAANYSKFSNAVNSMNILADFRTNRNKKFESFYESGIDKCLNYTEQRNEKMVSTFSNFASQIETYLQFREDLIINDLADKKKEKEMLVTKIIELSKKCSNIKETENSLSNFAKWEDGYAKSALQDAQRNASTLRQKYQTFFDNENKRRNDNLLNYLLANKTDLAVLMFIDLFPRDQHLALHKEIISALYEKYPNNPLVLERSKVEKSPANATSVGALAPDLAFENPDGKILKLSNLKGKVVLLDFWAGWCRPCRQENPNVVKMYKKYNEKGFEVFSVSLDRDKANWTKAIQDDGLLWPNHVSDLKQWQSEAAKIYGISAIPTTFLIDREGRIIAKNLRGAALENALKELFD